MRFWKALPKTTALMSRWRYLRFHQLLKWASFSFEPSPNYTTLTHLHPPTGLIFTLWQKFLDNVNPLIKVIHVPTVQQQILQASLSLDQVSRPMEALCNEDGLVP